ncbi:MAG: hypothetical protein ACNA7M_11500 [Roseovarius sp.]
MGERDGIRKLADVFRKIGKDLEPLSHIKIEFKLSQSQLDELEEQMKRIRAMRELPEGDPKREAWEPLLDMTPRQIQPFWRYLPDPGARRGRPKGRGKVGPETLEEMDRRVSSGERPTTAAKAIVGDMAGAKNVADHIVKVWKAKRGIK